VLRTQNESRRTRDGRLWVVALLVIAVTLALVTLRAVLG
jgi:hypothetical protein